ncbi:MAG: alginate lyase family protein [Rhizobacter sp.]|nr:alginate lyase family protein [Chlorobiales bacterium]
MPVIETYAQVLLHQVWKKNRFRWSYQKIAALSTAELRAAFQGFTAKSESLFIAEFRSKTRYSFFFSPLNRQEFFLSEMKSLGFPEATLQEAGDIMQNRFSVFGSPMHSFGERIDWHLDFISGKRLDEKTFSADVKLSEGTDVKVPLELSRFGLVWPLGKSYWLTRQPHYKEKFFELMSHWEKENPFCFGVNWMVPMEVALRAMNLIAGFYFFCNEDAADVNQDKPSETDAFWMNFLKLLFQHGLYLESNLEYTRRSGNHLISDALGLFMLGIFFKHTAEGAGWMAEGKRILETEILAQTYPDGADYEMSFAYHRLVTEMFLSAMALGNLNAQPFSPVYRERLEKMITFIVSYTKPDGAAPLIGDSDDGRLFWFSRAEDFNNHTSLFAAAAVLLNNGAFKAAAGGKFSEQALWLTGTDGRETFEKLRSVKVNLQSVRFPESQFVVLRSAAAQATIDAGELGKRGWGGHGHNDTLSFELFANGMNIVIDSGTYCYTSDPMLRNYFRSGKAHNSVMIDDKEIAAFDGPFKIKADRTAPKILLFEDDRYQSTLEAEHYAYTHLPQPITHRRTFTLHKEKNKFVVSDWLYGKGTHNAELFFHFAPEMEVEKSSYNKLYLTHKPSGLKVEIDFERTDEDIIIADGMVARRYGVSEQAKVLRFRKKFTGTMTFITTFTF